jgi:hypothetical protein
MDRPELFTRTGDRLSLETVFPCPRCGQLVPGTPDGLLSPHSDPDGAPCAVVEVRAPAPPRR